MARISIILPVRNGESTLSMALDSISSQTLSDFEVAIWDDGSTDRTGEILSDAAAQDSRIRIVGSEAVGLVSALQRAVAVTDSDLIARMDADDVCHPERLAAQVAMLDDNPDLALTGTLISCFPERKVMGGMRRYESWLNSLVTPRQIERDIFVESPLCHPTVMMRRTAYEIADCYVEDGNPEDYGLWLRFYQRKLRMAKVPRVLLKWRESDRRLTRTDPRYDSERFHQLKVQHLCLGPLARRKAVAIWGAGRGGKKWCRSLSEVEIETAAFIDIDPRKIGRKILGAPVLAPSELRRGIPTGYLIAAVGSHGAREKIRSFLATLNKTEPKHFICVA